MALRLAVAVAIIEWHLAKYSVTKYAHHCSVTLYHRPMVPSPHILIVDDDKEICALLSRFLSKHGYRATTARDGREMKEALADLKKFCPLVKWLGSYPAVS